MVGRDHHFRIAATNLKAVPSNVIKLERLLFGEANAAHRRVKNTSEILVYSVASQEASFRSADINSLVSLFYSQFHFSGDHLVSGKLKVDPLSVLLARKQHH